MTLKSISRQSSFYYVQWQASAIRSNKKGKGRLILPLMCR
jgi:hypothetical protein